MDELEGKGQEEDPLKDLTKEEQEKKKEIKNGKKTKKYCVESEVVDRVGEEGLVVIFKGKGSRKEGEARWAVISNETAEKIDIYTAGANAQVLGLLVELGFQTLVEQGKCISAVAKMK